MFPALQPILFSFLIVPGLFLSPAGAQALERDTASEARELLLRADAPVFDANTFWISGTKVTKTISPEARSAESTFMVAWSRGGRVRAEDGTGKMRRISVFDGTKLTDYFASSNTYSEKGAKSVPDAPLIQILRFGHDPANIASAALEREEALNFRGQMVACDVVRATYRGFVGNPAAKDVVRRVWIARDRSTILRDSWEMEVMFAGSLLKGGTVFNFDRVEWDTPLPDDLFVFRPPEGSKALKLPMVPTIVPESTPRQFPPLATGEGIGSGQASAGGLLQHGDPLAKMSPPSNGPGMGDGIAVPKITPPSVTQRVAPEYSPEARAANYQGAVLVSVDVDEKGQASNFRVVRGLGLGLDEKAIECVEHWQFSAGSKGGQPAKLWQTYEVVFRLPEGGPWRVEGATYLQNPPALSAAYPKPEVVSKPTLRRYLSPAASACSAIPGYAAVHLHIDTDGAPAYIKVLQSSSEAIGQAAMRAAQAWQFEPGTINGEPIGFDGTILLECGEPKFAGPSTLDRTYKALNGVTAPRILFKVEPDYSEEARKAKYQGTVLLSLVVDATGRPTSMFVVRPLGLGLDEKALEAVAQWRFKPGEKGGKTVAVQATIEVNFRLL